MRAIKEDTPETAKPVLSWPENKCGLQVPWPVAGTGSEPSVSASLTYTL